METEIHRIRLGLSNSYVIREEGVILVDAGFPGKGEHLQKRLQELSIAPEDIGLLLATHGHWDHVGSAAAIKRLTKCEVAINRREKEWLEEGLKPMPPGITPWGKMLGALLKIYMPFVSFSPASVDIVLDDEDYSLEPYGIQGRVVHTPGHSSGSMSLLLDSGHAFVGCLAHEGLPYRIGPGMPCFGDDIGVLRESWRLIVESGAKWIYPAHGKPFEAQVLAKLLQSA